MTRRHQVLEVARWEFSRFVKWRQQFVGLAIMLLIGAGSALFSRASARAAARTATVAVVNAEGLGFALPAVTGVAWDTATSRRDEPGAREALEDGVIRGVLLVVSADSASLLVQKRGAWVEPLQGALTTARRASAFARLATTPADQASLMANFAVGTVMVGGGEATTSKGTRIFVFAILGFGLIVLFSGLGTLFAGITGEKQQRVTEQMIAMVTPQTWMDGKILGLAAAGFAGTGIMVAGTAVLLRALPTLLGRAPFSLPAVASDHGLLALVLLITMLGVAMWYAFIAAIAATIDDPNSSTRTMLLFVPMLPTALAFTMAGKADSVLAQGLAIFPLTAMGMLPVRLMLTEVPWWEVVLALAGLVGGTWAFRRAAGKIFATGVLMYGKEPTLREMWRWSRAASLAGVLLGTWPSLADAQPARAPLDIARLVASPSLAGTSPVAPAWSADSRWVAFLWNSDARPARELWVVARDSTTPRRLTSAGTATSAFAWAPTAPVLYFLQGAGLWRTAVAGQATRIATGLEGAGDMAVSPDGRWVSLLRDGDVWVVPSTGGEPVRLTQVGVPAIGTIPLGTYYGPDVEIGGGTWGGPSYAWSPDSRTIAVHEVDRRAVRRVGIPYTVGAEPVMNLLRRSYPGDTNEVCRVGLLNVATRALHWLDLPDAANMRVVALAWSPAGQLLIDRETDDAIDRWIHVASATESPRVAWHDHRDTRIYNDIASAWHPDGRRILLTGDLDDRYRLYALAPGDSLPRPLTSGPSDVAGAGIAVPATRSIVFVSSAPDPSERHVWRVGGDGGVPMRLTSRPGVHAPYVSPDGRSLALLSSDDVTPPELWLTEATRLAEPRRVTHSPPAEFATVPWVRARYVTFPAKGDTFTLHARIIEPPALDRSKKYPVLFGPVYSNTVRNRWSGLYGMVQQMMAIEKGYIIVQVDVRGSTGYGREFREKFLMDWGGRDLDDLEAAADYMKSLPYVDGARLGIWGSSYGGTLTVYSLLRKPGLFAAGVAGAPATDPSAFGSDDVAIARRPQTHPETFKRGALQYAGNLRDHLLIIHGMQDDVVPFRTSVAMAEEFMRLGKDFDFAFAPAATHGWTQRPHYARFLLQKLVDHFDRYLGPGPR